MVETSAAWPTNEEAFRRANDRYNNDAEFHARVTVAERATIERLEAEGMTLFTSYRVAIRMAAILGLYVSEVPLGG